jgi:serine/threonine protein kinase
MWEKLEGLVCRASPGARVYCHIHIMGACSSRAPPVVEVGGAEPRPAAGKTPAASKRSARSSKRLGLGLGMSSRRSQDRWREEKSRSLVGNLMQTHTDEGPNALRLEDEYDNSTARVLGTGMSGQVITVKKRATGVEYAVKTLQIDQMGVDGLEALRSEINAMRRLDHPNIVKLFETFEDRELQQIHMIMELCTGGELVAQVTESRHGLPELDVARLLSKMISALSHCHANDVVHRDVKLENFVYESEGEGAELKMIDFGLSHLGRPDKGIEAKGRVGTLSYMAPEVLNRKPYAKECDMWSLGVVAYIMCARVPALRPPRASSARAPDHSLLSACPRPQPPLRVPQTAASSPRAPDHSLLPCDSEGFTFRLPQPQPSRSAPPAHARALSLSHAPTIARVGCRGDAPFTTRTVTRRSSSSVTPSLRTTGLRGVRSQTWPSSLSRRCW